MLKPSSSVVALTLAAFVQSQSGALWANPILLPEPVQKSLTPLVAYPPYTLYLGKDPYSHAMLKLQYNPEEKVLEWQLLNNGYVLSSQSYWMPANTQSVDHGLVFNGDLVVVAGRTIDQRWFIRALNSQGAYLWQRQGRGRIYDLAFRNDGQVLYAVGARRKQPLLLTVNTLSGIVGFDTTTDQTIDKEDFGGIYKQVVVTGENEVVVARHWEAKGQLRYVKWSGELDAVSGELIWSKVPEFCSGCELSGVKAIALKNDRHNGRFFAIASVGQQLDFSIMDATYGQTLQSQVVPVRSVEGIWNSVFRADFDETTEGEAFSISDYLSINLRSEFDSRLQVIGINCQLLLGWKNFNSKALTIETCKDHFVALGKPRQRRLLHSESSSEFGNKTAETTNEEDSRRDHLTIAAEVAGIVGVIGLITLVTGLGIYIHGKYKRWKEKVVTAGERENQRRRNEGDFIDNIVNRRPLFDFETLIIAPPSVSLNHGETSEIEVLPSSRTKTAQEMKQPKTPFDVMQDINKFLDNENECKMLDWLKKNKAAINLRDENGCTALHYLSDSMSEDVSQRRRQLKLARILLKSGADLNIRSNAGATPLELAAARKQNELFELMVSFKTSFSPDEVSLLFHLAVRSDDRSILDVLITKGLHRDKIVQPFDRKEYELTVPGWLFSKGVSQRSIKNERGMTILHEAVAHKNTEAVKLILHHEMVEVDALDEHKNTPLHLAACNLDSGITTILLDKEASVCSKNDYGDTPLHCAARGTLSMSIIDALVAKHADKGAKNNNKKTPLDLACEHGNLCTIDRLLGVKRDTTAVTEHPQTLHMKRDTTPVTVHPQTLHIMARRGFHAQIKKLGKSGLLKDIINSKVDNFAPLGMAIISRDFETVKTLVDCGSKVVVNDLVLAIEINSHEIVTYLLEKLRNNGLTPNGIIMIEVKISSLQYTTLGSFDTFETGSILHLAVIKKDPNVVKTILKFNKSLQDTKDNRGYTPLHLAASYGDVKIILAFCEQLDDSHKDDVTPIDRAVTEYHPGAACVLIEHGVKHNLGAETIRVLLEFAVSNGMIKAAEKLLDKDKADPNSKNDQDWTPLHFAAERGEAEAVKLLLKCGANKKLKNKKGDTPYNLATDEVVKTLLKESESETSYQEDEGGASLELPAISGETATKDHEPDKDQKELQEKTTEL